MKIVKHLMLKDIQMNIEFEKRVFEFKKFGALQTSVASEGLMIFKTNSLLISKFSSLLTDISNFISNKVVSGLLPTLNYLTKKETDFRKLQTKLDEYDYLSMRLLDFRIPQGLSLPYPNYIAWLTEEAQHCQDYIDKYSVILIGLIADIVDCPEKWAGNASIPRIEVFEKGSFDRGVREAFKKGGISKTRWMNLVKRNDDFLLTVRKLSDLCEQPLIKNYSEYVASIKDLIDRTNKFVSNITSSNTNIELSPKNITSISSAILSMAKAVEVFGLLTAYINDFVVVVDDNRNQILKMK